MADVRNNLLDIAKVNGTDDAVGLIDEASKVHPEVTQGAWRTIRGTQYKTRVRTALPTAAFRSANNGSDASKSTYEQRLVETFILNPRWNVDKAVADAYEDGPEAFIAMEADAILEAAMQTLCKCFYYGTDATYGDVAGFPGLLQSYDSTGMVVDAGGTTASTGSSVWAVRFGAKEVQWVLGQEGAIAVSPVRVETITGSNSKSLTGYVQELLGYPGLQVGMAQCVGRIKKLTADSGKGLTDSLMSTLFSKFRPGYEPNALFMTKRSLHQLQSQRTATNATGAPAPWPTEYEGIPIFTSEAISNVEPLTL